MHQPCKEKYIHFCMLERLIELCVKIYCAQQLLAAYLQLGKW
jgi:hypothetical protein